MEVAVSDRLKEMTELSDKVKAVVRTQYRKYMDVYVDGKLLEHPT